jgi:hypothetical protein
MAKRTVGWCISLQARELLPALYMPEQIDGRSIDNVVASSGASVHDRCSRQVRPPGMKPGTEALGVDTLANRINMID